MSNSSKLKRDDNQLENLITYFVVETRGGIIKMKEGWRLLRDIAIVLLNLLRLLRHNLGKYP